VLSLSAHTYSTPTNSMGGLTLHYATHTYTCRKESQTHRRWSKTRLMQNRGPSHSASPPSPFPFYFQLSLFTSLPWFLSFASLGASQQIHVDKYYSRDNLSSILWMALRRNPVLHSISKRGTLPATVPYWIFDFTICSPQK